MIIAFATIGDARDVTRGSGTPYYLSQALQKQRHTVHYSGPLNIKPPFMTRLFKLLSQKKRKKYFSYRDPFMGRAIGYAVERRLAHDSYDVLLTNDYCIAGYTRTKRPIILYTDDTFPYDYSSNVHPWLANLSKISVYFCQYTLRKGLLQSQKCIFASQFAAEEAEKYTKEKYLVIPYGANIEEPDVAIGKSIEAIRQKECLDLLFIGKDWERKGGEMAIRITKMLNDRGIHARLHVIGVGPPDEKREEHIKFYGLLNKNNPEERKRLYELFSNCDVLIVPSKAEGYGLVFAEAAAYGMPSLAYATTGVRTAVQSGKSGILFDSSEGEDAFVRQVETWFQHPNIYDDLSKGARSFYEQSVNWQVAVSNLIQEIKSNLYVMGR